MNVCAHFGTRCKLRIRSDLWTGCSLRVRRRTHRSWLTSLVRRKKVEGDKDSKANASVGSLLPADEVRHSRDD